MVKSGGDEVLAITRDITDRKRAEHEVVHQRHFLRTVVNTAQSIFCVVTTSTGPPVFPGDDLHSRNP